MTGKKWVVVTDKKTGEVSVVDKEHYRPPEAEKGPMPDWISDEPIRGKWRLIKDGDSYRLVPLSETILELHYVIQDTMEPLEVLATGEKFDSKSAYERRLKELGQVSTGGVKLSEISRKKQAEREKEYRDGIKQTFRETFEQMRTPSARDELLQMIQRKKETDWN